MFGIPEKTVAMAGTSALLQEAEKQLREYFDGRRKQFDLPLHPEGTEFQKKVWQALLTIPYGETRTYKEVAELVGNVNATRAVGGANNKNPLGIVVPCHRVIGANGKLVGYAGGVECKAYLLHLEQSSP
jgi:methylated-DNA-[protein]-cysteine S-methyltransferase